MNDMREVLTWIEGEVVYEAFPGDEGDLLDGGRGAAESKLLQMQQRVDEGTSSVQHLRDRIILNQSDLINLSLLTNQCV